MATVEIKQHIAKQRLPNGIVRDVDIKQDIVILTERRYDEYGTAIDDRVVCGYCDREPGAAFRPIVNGIPETLMMDIKRSLAERDAAITGQSVFDVFQRTIQKPPPAFGDDEHVNNEDNNDDSDSDG